MGQIDLSSLPVESQKQLPRHPVSVACIGRLAVDGKMKGRGLGGLLLADALKRIKLVSTEIDVFAVVVDAKDQAAKSFYEKYGFVELTSDPMALFFPVASIPDPDYGGGICFDITWFGTNLCGAKLHLSFHILMCGGSP